METKERACANSPLMSRRNLIASAPMFALAGPVPAAMAQAETPVAALFREWQRYDAAIRAADAAGDHVAADQAYEDRWEIERKLINTPSQCDRDLLLKILAWTACGLTDLEAEYRTLHLSPLWAEARALIGA